MYKIGLYFFLFYNLCCTGSSEDPILKKFQTRLKNQKGGQSQNKFNEAKLPEKKTRDLDLITNLLVLEVSKLPDLPTDYVQVDQTTINEESKQNNLFFVEPELLNNPLKSENEYPSITTAKKEENVVVESNVSCLLPKIDASTTYYPSDFNDYPFHDAETNALKYETTKDPSNFERAFKFSSIRKSIASKLSNLRSRNKKNKPTIQSKESVEPSFLTDWTSNSPSHEVSEILNDYNSIESGSIHSKGSKEEIGYSKTDYSNNNSNFQSQNAKVEDQLFRETRV